MVFRSMLLAATMAVATMPAEAETTTSWSIAEFGEPLYKDGIEHWPYVNPDAPKGGSIVLGAFGTFDSLNSYILKGNIPCLLYTSPSPRD